MLNANKWKNGTYGQSREVLVAMVDTFDIVDRVAAKDTLIGNWNKLAREGRFTLGPIKADRVGFSFKVYGEREHKSERLAL